LKILIGCEFSGIVREEFRKLGHDAWSCDLLETEIPGQHIKGNIVHQLWNRWDMIIAFPPCTRLANSGVRWLHERNLWAEMYQACEFFNMFQTQGETTKVAIENPIPHKYAREYIGKYSQIIQPWQFGHGETKATCLWLYNLPKLKPTNIVSGREQKVFKTPPSKDRWKIRSRTFKGIAEAMASQWSCL